MIQLLRENETNGIYDTIT